MVSHYHRHQPLSNAFIMATVITPMDLRQQLPNLSDNVFTCVLLFCVPLFMLDFFQMLLDEVIKY